MELNPTIILFFIVIVVLFILINIIGRIIIYSTMVRDSICPKCKNRYWERLKRNPFEKMLTLGTKIRRYRCDNPECQHVVFRISRRYTQGRAK